MGRRGTRRPPSLVDVHGTSGHSLLDLIFTLTLTVVLTAIAVAQTTTNIEQARTVGAARFVAGQFSLARTQAVARGANVAVLLTGAVDGVSIATHRDGNGNGVRTAEIGAGVDPLISGPVRVGDLFPGVSVAVNSPTNVLNAGSTALMSFSPVATASSGTVYLQGRDRSQYAVRVLGATGRTRVLRYLASRNAWVPVF